MTRPGFLSPLTIMLALAACNPSPDTANRSDGATAAVSLPTPSPTATGTGGPAPLSERDAAEAALAGELACSFTDSAGRPLLIARGDVGTAAPAAAIARVGDAVVRLGAPGGFNAMVKGAAFGGDAVTVRVEPTGPAVGGGESPPLPATLTLEREGAAPFATSGDWTCGP